MLAKMRNLYLKQWAHCHILRDRLKQSMQNTIGNESGVATEYALLIAVVCAGVIVAATAFFEPLQDFFKAAVQQIFGVMTENKPG